MQSENYGYEVNQPYKHAAKLAGALLVLLQLVALVPQVMHAQAAATFSSANAILSLSPDRAKPPAAAHLQGVVTVVGQGGLFLQDASAGIWIFCPDPFRMHTGDEIVVDGVVGSGTYSPVVNARSVRRLGRSAISTASSYQSRAGSVPQVCARLNLADHGSSCSYQVASCMCRCHWKNWSEAKNSSAAMFVCSPLRPAPKMQGDRLHRQRSLSQIWIA